MIFWLILSSERKYVNNKTSKWKLKSIPDMHYLFHKLHIHNCLKTNDALSTLPSIHALKYATKKVHAIVGYRLNLHDSE